MKMSSIVISLVFFSLFSCGRAEVESHGTAISASDIELPSNYERTLLQLPNFSQDQKIIWKQLDPGMEHATGLYFSLKAVQYAAIKLGEHYTNSRNGDVKFLALRGKWVDNANEHDYSFVLTSNKPTSRDGHFACYQVQASASVGPTDFYFDVYKVKLLNFSNSNCSN